MRGSGPKSSIACLSRNILYISIGYPSISSACKVTTARDAPSVCDISSGIVLCLDNSYTFIYEYEKDVSDKL